MWTQDFLGQVHTLNASSQYDCIMLQKHSDLTMWIMAGKRKLVKGEDNAAWMVLPSLWMGKISSPFVVTFGEKNAVREREHLFFCSGVQMHPLLVGKQYRFQLHISRQRVHELKCHHWKGPVSSRHPLNGFRGRAQPQWWLPQTRREEQLLAYGWLIYQWCCFPCKHNVRKKEVEVLNAAGWATIQNLANGVTFLALQERCLAEPAVSHIMTGGGGSLLRSSCSVASIINYASNTPITNVWGRSDGDL